MSRDLAFHFALNHLHPLNSRPQQTEGQDVMDPVSLQLVSVHRRVWKTEPVDHQLLCGLFFQGQAISSHAYEFVDLAERRPASAALLYPVHYLEQLKQMGFRRVMAMEALAVDESFRGLKWTDFALSAAELTIACGLRLAQQISEVQSVIACTRDSRAVNRMALAAGFVDTGLKIRVHDEPSSLMFHRLETIGSSRAGAVFDQIQYSDRKIPSWASLTLPLPNTRPPTHARRYANTV